MLDNNDIRAGLISWLKANTNIVGVLTSGSSSANEIRERNWQGEDFIYPNIRVTCSSTPQQCGYSDVQATVSFFSEQASSKQSLVGQGRIAKEMHNKSVTQGSMQFVNMHVTSLPDAIQMDRGWQADVQLSLKAAGSTSLAYIQKVQNLNPIAYWPLYDDAGTTSVAELIGVGNGAASHVTFGVTGIGDGETAGSFNGISGSVNVFTSALASAFDSDEFTMSVWAKVNAASAWTDGLERYLFKLGVNILNRVGIYKNSAANSVSAWYYGSGAGVFVNFPSFSSVNWFHFALTVSKSADQFIGYLNGTAGSPTTGLPSWAGTLANGECLIGSYQANVSAFSGSLAHVALWDKVLTPAQISRLASVEA